MTTRAEIAAEQRGTHTRPRGKPHAFVDSDGNVYSTKRSSGMPTIIFICIGFALLGALAMMNRFEIPFSALQEPLATASVPTRTAAPSVPTAPYAPPLASGGGKGEGGALAEQPAEPVSDYGAAAYNATQQARATELALQDAPAGASEAEIDAWLAAPVSTPTPTRGVPEIVSDAVFDASFVDSPECNPFIGYIGPKKAQCDAVYAEQTATAGE